MGQRPRLREPRSRACRSWLTVVASVWSAVGFFPGWSSTRFSFFPDRLAVTASATWAAVKSYRPTVSVSRGAGQEGLERRPAGVGTGAERDRRLRLDRIQGHAGRAAVGELWFGDGRQLGVRRRGRRRAGARQRPLLGEVRHRAQVRRQPEAGRVLLRVLELQGLLRRRLPNVHRHPAHLGGQHLALRGMRDLVPDRDDDGRRVGQPVVLDLETGPHGQHPGLVESRHVLLDNGIDVRRASAIFPTPASSLAVARRDR